MSSSCYVRQFRSRSSVWLSDWLSKVPEPTEPPLPQLHRSVDAEPCLDSALCELRFPQEYWLVEDWADLIVAAADVPAR